MNTRWMKFLAMAALAASMTTGCGDDDDNGNSTNSCITNDTKCANGAYSICQNGTWGAAVTCPFGCDVSGKTCAPQSNPAAQCVPGSSKCENSIASTCINGVWGAATPCSNGCDAAGLQCANSGTTLCIGGQIKCENNAQYICTGNNWNKSQDCAAGCAADGQSCASTPCTPGTTQCNGAYVQTCQSGSWVNATTPCANGCYQGVCKSSSTPSTGSHKLGDACSEEYATYCGGDTLLMCKGSKLVYAYEDGAACSAVYNGGYCDDIADMAEEGYAECVVPCSADYEYDIVDVDSYCDDDGEFAAYICAKGSSGKYSVFTYDYVTTLCNDDTSAITCKGPNTDVVLESCTSCKMASSSAESDVCSGAKVITGKSSAKLNGACSKEYEMACDGNILIYCDGKNYKPVAASQAGEAYSCSDLYGAGFFCDESTLTNGAESIRAADCIELCPQEADGYVVDISEECEDGEFDLYVCMKSDAGNYGVFGYTIPLMYADTVCMDNASALICSSANGSVVEKKCSSCTTDATSGDDVCK